EAMGYTSKAYEDLITTYKATSTAVAHLDDLQQKAVKNIVDNVGYIEGSDAAYRTLTRSLQRASEEARILGEYTADEKKGMRASIALLVAQGVAREEAVKQARKQVDAATKKAAADALATKAEEASTAATKTTNEAKEAQKLINSAAADATAKLSKETLGLSTEELKLQIALNAAKINLAEKVKALKEATKDTTAYELAEYELALAQKALAEQTDRTKKSLNEYSAALQNLNNKEVKSYLKTLHENVRDLDKEWKSGAITLGEYEETSRKLSSAISEAEKNIGSETKAVKENTTAVKENK
ncbi:MAG: hypothetical protein ACKVJE_19580, partial [Pseudomonadales bacterium]